MIGRPTIPPTPQKEIALSQIMRTLLKSTLVRMIAIQGTPTPMHDISLFPRLIVS